MAGTRARNSPSWCSRCARWRIEQGAESCSTARWLPDSAAATSPVVVAPRTNERAHWVAPKVVVEVKFAEWTKERLLRQPIFLGVRDDKQARDVTIEGVSLQRWGTGEMTNDAA